MTNQTISLKRNSLLTSLFVGLLLIGCTIQQPRRSGQQGALYHRADAGFHPQWVIFHASDDSSQIFFRLPSADLLPARKSADDPLQISLELSYALTDTAGVLLAQGSIRFDQVHEPDQLFWMGQLALPTPAQRSLLSIKLSDTHRDQQEEFALVCDKSDRLGPQNFMLRDFHTAQPIFGGAVSSGDWIEISHPRASASS
ncbi:MAG: hypothetical protein ACKO66_12105, partial [Flavobacteriales bacterium]